MVFVLFLYIKNVPHVQDGGMVALKLQNVWVLLQVSLLVHTKEKYCRKGLPVGIQATEQPSFLYLPVTYHPYNNLELYWCKEKAPASLQFDKLLLLISSTTVLSKLHIRTYAMFVFYLFFLEKKILQWKAARVQLLPITISDYLPFLATIGIRLLERFIYFLYFHSSI